MLPYYKCNVTISAGGIKSLRTGFSDGMTAPFEVEKPTESRTAAIAEFGRGTRIDKL